MIDYYKTLLRRRQWATMIALFFVSYGLGHLSYTLREASMVDQNMLTWAWAKLSFVGSAACVTVIVSFVSVKLYKWCTKC